MENILKQKTQIFCKTIAVFILFATALVACDDEESITTVNPQGMYGQHTLDIKFNGYTIPFSNVKIEQIPGDDSKIEVTMDFMPNTNDRFCVVADATAGENEITFSGTCRTLYYNFTLDGKYHPAESNYGDPLLEISCTGKPKVSYVAGRSFEFDINEDLFNLAECLPGQTEYNGKIYENISTVSQALGNIGKELSEKYSKMRFDINPAGPVDISLMAKGSSDYKPWMTVMGWWSDNEYGPALLLELTREDVNLFNSTWFGKPNAQHWTPVFGGVRDILSLTYWPNQDYILLSMSNMQTKAAFDMYTIGDGSRWTDAEEREQLKAARAIVWSTECLITFAGQHVE